MSEQRAPRGPRAAVQWPQLDAQGRVPQAVRSEIEATRAELHLRYVLPVCEWLSCHILCRESVEALRQALREYARQAKQQK